MTATLGGQIRHGLDTTHLSAANRDRAYRTAQQAAALAYLHRTGNHDLAPILGLTAPAGDRLCAHCRNPLPRSAKRARYCQRQACRAVKRRTEETS